MATRRRVERLGARLGTTLGKRPLPVVLAWLVIAGLLNLLVPRLETVVARDATPVRALLVPSLAPLLGPANWWPSVRRDSSRPSAERAAAG